MARAKQPPANLTEPRSGSYLAGANGAVAQLGERINRTDEARGSSPLSSTPRLAGKCRNKDLRGAVAQLGARLTGSQKVRGSNPLSSTFLRKSIGFKKG